MHIEPECISCIFNQALRVTKTLGLDPNQSKNILDESAKMLPEFSLSKTPPQNAKPMYEMMARVLKTDDIYKKEKKEAIKLATKLMPFARSLISKSNNPFVTATKIAVSGNVIDLASEFVYDLEEEINKVLHTKFAFDDINTLYKNIQKSKTLVYLADNAGENVFDRLYIETIKKLFKSIKIYYFVRAKPIINDICFDDLKDDEIHKYATVINSGVSTPGIVFEDLSSEAKKLFLEADCIISKGMGNYECLSDYKEFSIYYLLKVKCRVVARDLGLDPGDLVCKYVQK